MLFRSKWLNCDASDNIAPMGVVRTAVKDGDNLYITFRNNDVKEDEVSITRGNENDIFLNNASKDLTLGKRVHTVTFNKNNNEDSIIEEVDFMEAVSAIAKPVNGELRFIGWFLDETYTTPYNFDNLVRMNIILNAKWGDKFVGTYEVSPTLSGIYETKVENLILDSSKTKVMYDGVEVAGIWNLSDVNRGDIPEVGTKKAYDVTFTPDNTDDYAIIKESVVPQIEKKSLEVLGVPELKGIYGDKVTDMELTGGMVEPSVAGEFTVTDKNQSDVPKVGTAKAYEVTFIPEDTNNYEVIKTLVTPVISKKTVVVENAPTLTGTYGDKLSELVIGNGTMIEDIEGEWTVTQNGSEAIYPVVGGTTSYEVSFIPKDNNYAPFKVNIVPIMEKKDIVIRIKDVTTVLGEKISKFDFDIIEGSLAANDTLESLNVKITTDADEASKVGKYKLLFESADNINYNVKAENDGVYEVVKKSEGITTKPTTKPPTTKPTTKPPTTKPTTESNNPANTGETNTISKVATGDVVPAGLILLLVGTVVIITIMQTKKTNKL